MSDDLFHGGEAEMVVRGDRCGLPGGFTNSPASYAFAFMRVTEVNFFRARS